jgi:hypothetical protein
MSEVDEELNLKMDTVRVSTRRTRAVMTTPPLPATFPPLPVDEMSWSANTHAAHKVISDLYAHAVRVIHQDETDPARLAFHINSLSTDALSLLQALAEDGGQENHALPGSWLIQCSRILGEAVWHLKSSTGNGQSRYAERKKCTSHLAHEGTVKICMFMYRVLSP